MNDREGVDVGDGTPSGPAFEAWQREQAAAAHPPPSMELVFEDSQRGYVRGDARLPYPQAQAIAADLAELAAGVAEVRIEIWAGPYEIIVAAFSGGGIAAVLNLLASRHPQVRFTVKLEDGSEVEWTGRKLPAALEDRVDQFFADRAALPGYGQPPGLPQPEVRAKHEDVGDGEADDEI